MTAWDEQLDRFEDCLSAQRSALAEGRPEDIDDFVPVAAGPIPAHLVERARGLSAQAEALTAALSSAAVATSKRLHLLAAVIRPDTPGAAFVDVRG